MVLSISFCLVASSCLEILPEIQPRSLLLQLSSKAWLEAWLSRAEGDACRAPVQEKKRTEQVWKRNLGDRHWKWQAREAQHSTAQGASLQDKRLCFCWPKARFPQTQASCSFAPSEQNLQQGAWAQSTVKPLGLASEPAPVWRWLSLPVRPAGPFCRLCILFLCLFIVVSMVGMLMPREEVKKRTSGSRLSPSTLLKQGVSAFLACGGCSPG